MVYIRMELFDGLHKNWIVWWFTLEWNCLMVYTSIVLFVLPYNWIVWWFTLEWNCLMVFSRIRLLMIFNLYGIVKWFTFKYFTVLFQCAWLYHLWVSCYTMLYIMLYIIFHYHAILIWHPLHLISNAYITEAYWLYIQDCIIRYQLYVSVYDQILVMYV